MTKSITFKDLALAPAIQQALDALGFVNPTEIQQKAIPVLLGAQKVDLLGQAETGTGKTFAFGIPLMHKIDPKTKNVQALIVAPTRELVIQIRDNLRQLTKFTDNIVIEAVYGGVSMPEQIYALKRGVHIVVGTPGRLNDHIRRKTLNLSNLSTLILDEADTMLDMGFKEEVDEILSSIPSDRQIWLFSATIKSGVNDLMRSHMKNTVSILVDRKEASAINTKQYFSIIPRQARLEALCRFIDNAPEFYGFIFCQTKMLTAEVAEKLTKRGYGVNALHGDMSQVQRNQVIKRFKKKEFAILVATDVAARGIDVSDATHVINFSLPDDQESYVHRVGRTGRAGKEGTAITFVTQSDLRRLRIVGQKYKFEIKALDVPKIDTIANSAQEKALASLIVSSKQLSVSNKFIDHLLAKVSEYAKEDLAMALANSLYDKFLGPIMPDKELNLPSSTECGNSSYGSDEVLNEFFINVGEDDGIDKMDIINFLVSSEKVTIQDVKKIKILRKHTFAVVPEKQAQDTLEALHGKQLNGIRVRISITNEVPDLNRGGFGGGDRRRSRGSNSEGSRGGFGGGRGGYYEGGRSRGGRSSARGGSYEGSRSPRY